MGLNDSREPAPRTERMGSQPESNIPARVIVGILTAVGEPEHNASGQTVILVPDLENRSSAPDAGVLALSADLRQQLASAGAASKMAFVDQSVLGNVAQPHYILKGEAFTVQKNGQKYWEVFFTLYDVDPMTGAKHDRRWENAPGYLVPR